MMPLALPVVAVAAPLVLALLAPWLGRSVWPLYALAGLVLLAAGLVPSPSVTAPGLLLGMTLEADPAFAAVMAGSGAVWAAAALHARGSMGDGAGARVFACLFGLALAGNALLLVAGDMVSFYVGYSVMSLSAWGLVAHERTPASSVAAQVYLAFAVAGELCLFAALMLIDAAQDSLLVPRGLGIAPPEAAVWLAIAAFGVKAGLFPLHVWLPLAHPAAPVPASAALSGAMLKAGIVGALKLAPPALFAPAAGEAAAAGIAALGDTLIALGLFAAFAAGLYGAFCGQRKTALAYSSVSQLSLALALLGAGYAGHADATLVAGALAVFALHHALAKGALFLGADSGLPRPLAIAAFAVAALALTGMPFTLGEASKRAFETALHDGATAGAPVDLATLFAAAAFATAAVMARALGLPWKDARGVEPWRAAGVLALTAALVIAALPEATLRDADGLLKSMLPGLAMLAGALLVARLPAWGRHLPAGDLVTLVPSLRGGAGAGAPSRPAAKPAGRA